MRFCKKAINKALLAAMFFSLVVIVNQKDVLADSVRTSVEIPAGYEDSHSCGTIYIDGVAFDTVVNEFGYVSFDVPQGSQFATMYKIIQKNGVWGPTAMTVWDVSKVRERHEEFSGDVDSEFGEVEDDTDEENDKDKSQTNQEDEESQNDINKDDDKNDQNDKDKNDNQNDNDDQENQDDQDAKSGDDDLDDESTKSKDTDEDDDKDGTKTGTDEKDENDENDTDKDVEGETKKDTDEDEDADKKDNDEGKDIDKNQKKEGEEESEKSADEVDEQNLENEDCEPKLIKEFTDLFMYKGFSIRITGQGGIRAKTGIKTSAKMQLLSEEGLAGYRLIEYGQIAKSKEKLENQYDGKFVISEGISPAKCYWKANGKVNDKYLSDSDNNYVIFANALDVPSTNFDTAVSFRAYVKLEKIEDGSEVVLYGPVVTKSIYDVALSRLAASDINDKGRIEEKKYVSLVKGTVELKDGTIVFIGDGIMQGNLNGNINVDTPFPNIVMDKLREKYCGVNISKEENTYFGATLGIPGAYGYKGSVMKLSKEITAEAPKVIVIMAGNNDWHYSVQHQGTNRDPETGHFQGKEDCSAVFGAYNSNGLIKYANGQPFDPLTQKFESTSNYNRPEDLNYCSGIWMTLDYLTNKYPSTKIVLVTTCQSRLNGYTGTTYSNPSTGKKLWEYVNAEKAIAGYYKDTLHKKVYVIDLYNEWEGGKDNSSSFYSYFETQTGNQPNQEGHNVIGDFVFNKLSKEVIEK